MLNVRVIRLTENCFQINQVHIVSKIRPIFSSLFINYEFLFQIIFKLTNENPLHSLFIGGEL